MKRLVYAPKVEAWVKTDYGIKDITEVITAGQVNRKLDQVSSAELTIRNPGKIFTDHHYTDRLSKEPVIGPVFHPMDPIVISLTRLQNRPVQVFTGFLDTSPYVQMFPGTVTLKASCTLKKLLYTYYDPGVKFFSEFLAQYGWQNVDGFGAVNPEQEKAKATHTGAVEETGLGEVLFGVLQDIGHWPEDAIYIEKIPPNLIELVSQLFEEVKPEAEEGNKQLTKTLHKIIGTASLGSGVFNYAESAAETVSNVVSATAMYDSTDVNKIPQNAQAVAGYVGGSWPTFNELKTRFPTAAKLSIAVNASEDADCLDIEPGDATPNEAPAWVKRQHANGVTKPCLYGSVSIIDAIHAELTAAGISRSSYRLWSAHWTQKHICGPSSCGSCQTECDATQWTTHGETYDESQLKEGFF